MKVSVLAFLLFLTVTTSNASPLILETKNNVLKLPNTWKVVDLSREAKLRGPNKELLTIAAIKISGFKIASGGSEDDWRRSRKEFGEHVQSKMVKASKSSDLKIVSPMSESNSSSGYPVWEIKTETINGQRFFNLYGAVGEKEVLFITLDGKIKNESTSSEVLHAIKNIEWK